LIWVRFCTQPRFLQLTSLCLVLCGYPQYIVLKGEELQDNNETIESLFYPLYNMILSYWFPFTEGYDVCPHWTIPGSQNSAIAFVVRHRRHPLLLVEIKAPSEFKLDSGRHAAIAQIPERLDELGPQNQHVDRLYAISAVGKKWRACYTLKGKGSDGAQPVTGVAESSSLRDFDPNCWNPDITSGASWAALMGIVETIKGYVDQ